MSVSQTAGRPGDVPLRLWPGVVIVLVEWAAWLVGPVIFSGDAAMWAVVCGLLLGAVGVPVWWTFFSRAPRLERWGAVPLAIVVLAVTPRLLHESVAKGNLGFQFYVYSIPVLTLAFVVWAAAGQRLADRPRRAALVATVLLACGAFTLLRSEGLAGDGSAEFVWRWARSPEERLLAQAADDGPAALPRPGRAMPPTAAVAGVERDWPGFRGSARDGVVRGITIETDWTASPPVELWRRPVGPGVSSFAVGRGLVYTQEQRGEDEIVACYRLDTGEPVWAHRDAVRFWDAHVGAGPRATPALANGRVYALGASGIVNALDAGDGRVVWSRDAAGDTGARDHMFGFVGSPLVTGDLVVVATGGRLVAYDAGSGEPRWFGPERDGGYSSPHLLTVGGTAQIVLVTGDGVIGVDPAGGALLWEHAWPGIGIVQPALSADGDVLISQTSDAAAPIGTRRLAVADGPGGWTVTERWTSSGLKPSFSAFVVHEGHAFGFDGRILAAIDVGTGERAWKGGRYGAGQLLLLAEQDLLLVVSERGELALVAAAPDGYSELARFAAIEGKTWNQPALAGDVLLVRNGEEMAAFRLAGAAAQGEADRVDAAMEARLDEAWTAVREYLERREAGPEAGQDPQPALAASFFAYHREHPDTPTGLKAGDTAFTMWGNLGATDEVERALPHLAPDSELWGRVLHSIGNAYGRAERWEDYTALLSRLAGVLTHPRSRSELLLDLGRYHVDADEPREARDAYEEVIRLAAHPFDVQKANGALYEMDSLVVGQAAPGFTAETLDGETVSLADLRGSVVLLEFWSMSCGPCLPEIPHLAGLHATLPRSEFRLIGVTQDEDLEALGQFMQREGMRWPQIRQLARFRDDVLEQDPLLERYHVFGIPRSFLVDRDGRIAAKDLRGEELATAARELVNGDRPGSGSGGDPDGR